MKRWIRVIACSLSCLVPLCQLTLAAPKDDGKAITDPASAGPMFAIQGEYEGKLDGELWGVQVIALNDRDFDLVGFDGGLPGHGWNRGMETQRGSGTLEQATGKAKGEGWTARIENGKLTVTIDGGTILGTLDKVERTSPTLGEKAPEGAMVLFNGSNTDAFEKGEMSDGLLAATNCYSKEKFGDHHLHLEFRTPYMPDARGQGRGNSGLYLQGRYECQILDSFGLEGKDNECGGIYSIHAPDLNMCLPPLSWQTYDVDFQAARYDASGNKTAPARVTIVHNGVTIHRDLELPHGTPGHLAEGPGPEHIFLQNHGNPVHFRNIWVVKK